MEMLFIPEKPENSLQLSMNQFVMIQQYQFIDFKNLRQYRVNNIAA